MPRTWGAFFWDITAGPFVGYSASAPVVPLQEVKEPVAIPELKIEPIVEAEVSPAHQVSTPVPQKKKPKPRRWEHPKDYLAPRPSQQSHLWKQRPVPAPEDLNAHKKLPEVPPGYQWPKY